jgi:hypothetical protein
MTRLVIAFASLALALGLGCSGGKGKQATATTGTGEGSAGPARLAKRVTISWGITPVGEMADIFLATTDETGAQVSHSIGRYKGTCSVFAPAPEMKALTGVQCTAGGGGTELHAVAQGGDQIIVLQMPFTEGAPQDPMNRKEIISVKVPLGVAISVDPTVSTTGAP